MNLPPLTPLGKPLSQGPVAGSSAAPSAPAAASQPITAFQWMSLARATWMWILRPIWYLCFVFPTRIMSGGARSRDEEQQLLDEHFRKQRRH
ncbi:hypothetical protein G6F68_014496 [Rhizopus microsporus]|nr:hypothetical protein G6F68_014496 [Rhizopus microsporus]